MTETKKDRIFDFVPRRCGSLNQRTKWQSVMPQRKKISNLKAILFSFVWVHKTPKNYRKSEYFGILISHLRLMSYIRD